MGKHSQPETGDGRTSGRKPERLELSVKTKNGAHLSKSTTDTFGSLKKGKVDKKDNK